MPIDFERAFTASPNPYVIVDRELRIVWMNEAYLQATMREREDITGRRMFDAFPVDPASESYRQLADSFARVIETGERDEIALIRYDIPRPDGDMDVRYWSATHVPLHDAAGRTDYILQHTMDVTELHDLRAAREATRVVERAQAVEKRYGTLNEEARQLRTLFEQAPGFIAVLSGPEHRFMTANAAYLRLVGDRDIVGKPLLEALPEVVDQGFVAILDAVRSTGEPYHGENAEITLTNAAGQPERRFLDFIYQPIFAAGGDVSGIFVQGHDVTDQVLARSRQELLIAELNHRVKNTLAVVNGLAAQSFRTVAGADGARRNFDARINALAAAHSLLTASNWEAARLRDIIRSSIEATAGSDIARVELSGGDTTLEPQTAVSLAMIVHELTTNAIKYGALSVPGGQVRVRWSLEPHPDGQMLRIDWQESGGPAVTEPARPGFGSRLIRSGLSSGGAGEVFMNFAHEGFHCTIETLLKDQSCA